MTIGVLADGKIVQRPVFGRVAAYGRRRHRLRVLRPAGPRRPFTPLLWRLPVGHRMRMIGPKGKFLLEPDDDRTHLFISSGTGNAPFISMMRERRRRATRKAVFLNGVSYVQDLGYRDLLEGWERRGEYPVTFVPTVSRPNDPANAGWTGPDGPRRDRSSTVCRRPSGSTRRTVVYICGNPEMILTAESVLMARASPNSRSRRSSTGRRARTRRPSRPLPRQAGGCVQTARRRADRSPSRVTFGTP